MPYQMLVAAENADEEKLWRELLQNMQMIALTGSYISGAALLASAELHLPDMIILSGRLEEISGITAAQILRQRMGKRLFLVLVCDEGDFSSAREAVAFRADMLLTRPILRKDMESVVTEFLSRRMESISDNTDAGYKQIIGRLYRDRIHRMTGEQYLPEEMVNSAYGTAFQPGAYRIVIICVDLLQENSVQDAFQILEKRLSQLFAQLERVCRETLPLMSAALQRQWVLNYSPEQDEMIQNMLRTQAEELLSWLPDAIRVTFCCSECCEQMKDLRKKLNEASEMKWSRFLNRDCYLNYRGEMPCPEWEEEQFRNIEKQLISACTTLDLPLFRNELQHLFSLPNEMVGHSRARKLIRRVENHMFETNRELIASFTSVEHMAQQMEISLQQASSLEDYKKRYTDHMMKLFVQIRDAVDKQGTKPVYMAKRYVRNHFAEAIRLEDVALYVGLNKTYLSHLFRKEAGIGLPDYINQCRIGEAKRLLETTDLKILSIADMTGFSDPRYFSRVFHAWEGCRPKDYRAAKQRGNRDVNR